MTKFVQLLLVITYAIYGMNSCYSEEYPASVSFLVADYKYNEKEGVKICEIQSLGISSISISEGYKKLCKQGEISFEKITETLNPYFTNMWLVKWGMKDPKIRSKLEKDGWQVKKLIKKLEKSPSFFQLAKKTVDDPSNLKSYHGLLCVRKEQIQFLEEFKSKYPGILIVGEFMFPYRDNKYKLTIPFDQDPELQKYKPRWGRYPKVYTRELAETILRDLDCDAFVIKPIAEYRGNGVCIVGKEELNSMLRAIITKEGLPLEGKRAYWKIDRNTDFIVEQFIESDALAVPRRKYRKFAPTYRMIFCVLSHKDEIHVQPIGAFGKLPARSLDQIGSIEEKHKSVSRENSCYTKIPFETRKEMERQLKDCMTLYYRQVLRQSYN